MAKVTPTKKKNKKKKEPTVTLREAALNSFNSKVREHPSFQSAEDYIQWAAKHEDLSTVKLCRLVQFHHNDNTVTVIVDICKVIDGLTAFKAADLNLSPNQYQNYTVGAETPLRTSLEDAVAGKTKILIDDILDTDVMMPWTANRTLKPLTATKLIGLTKDIYPISAASLPSHPSPSQSSAQVAARLSRCYVAQSLIHTHVLRRLNERVSKSLESQEMTEKTHGRIRPQMGHLHELAVRSDLRKELAAGAERLTITSLYELINFVGTGIGLSPYVCTQGLGKLVTFLFRGFGDFRQTDDLTTWSSLSPIEMVHCYLNQASEAKGYKTHGWRATGDELRGALEGLIPAVRRASNLPHELAHQLMYLQPRLAFAAFYMLICPEFYKPKGRDFSTWEWPALILEFDFRGDFTSVTENTVLYRGGEAKLSASCKLLHNFAFMLTDPAIPAAEAQLERRVMLIEGVLNFCFAKRGLYCMTVYTAAKEGKSASAIKQMNIKRRLVRESNPAPSEAPRQRYEHLLEDGQSELTDEGLEWLRLIRSIPVEL